MKRHLSHVSSTGDFKLVRGMQTWQNWVDLVRGGAGTYLLVHHALRAPEGEEWTRFGWILGIILISLLLQTIRRYRQKTFFLAPVFFIWGLTFVMAGPLLALYGILPSILVANVATNLELKLPIMAVIIGVAALLIPTIAIGPILTINLIAILFPLLVTFLGRGRMVFLMPEEKRK